MHQREHWVYALPIDERAIAVAAPVTGLELSRREDLEVTLVEARGEQAALALAELLKSCGFFAQSTLLESAYDVATEDAQKALLTLAHMAIAWDATWAELFQLHLDDESSDVRLCAVRALCVAARTSGALREVRAMLASAAPRERDAAVRAALSDALAEL
jgi:hypothetical protein